MGVWIVAGAAVGWVIGLRGLDVEVTAVAVGADVLWLTGPHGRHHGLAQLTMPLVHLLFGDGTLAALFLSLFMGGAGELVLHLPSEV